jgi:CTP synthase
VEVDENTPYPVIDLMTTQRGVTRKGGTMRLGAYPCVLAEGSLALRLYGKRNIKERHRHRYEVSNEHRDVLEKHGLVLSGLSPDASLVEIIELRDHPFFIASQFHPEFRSRPLDCHPMFKGFIRAVLQHKTERDRTPLLSAVSS